MSKKYVNDLSSNIADNAKAMVFGSESGYSYWLASRGVSANSHFAYFGPGRVVDGGAGSCYYLFYSDGVSHIYRYCRLRPLVSLTSDIPAAGNILEFSDT